MTLGHRSPSSACLWCEAGLDRCVPRADDRRASADRAAAEPLHDRDVVVIAQKIVSKAEGRTVDLATVTPSAKAARAGGARWAKTRGSSRSSCRNSVRVVRSRPNLMIMQHRLGFVMANAGVDQSNVAPADGHQRALLLPVDPDGSAEAIRARAGGTFRCPTWRASSATVSAAPGVAARPESRSAAAGLPSLIDLRGQPDLFGRTLEVSIIGFADEIAAAASLLQGQAAEAPAGRGRARPDLDGARCAGCGTGTPAGGGSRFPLIIALSGGVGGAKLALGLSRIMPPEELAGRRQYRRRFRASGAVDLARHRYCRVYAGRAWRTANSAGAAMTKPGRSWKRMEALGGETWFRLGDRDIALHVERTRRLKRRRKPVRRHRGSVPPAWGSGPRVVPMTDDPVRTRLLHRSRAGWIFRSISCIAAVSRW